MFGPDTALMFDAIQMVAIAAGVSGGAVYLLLRRRKASTHRKVIDQASNLDLESRVRVLERIATDRSDDLSDEIEALRDDTKQGSMS